MPTTRYASIDALRGVAIVWMTVFHFSFDLAWLGFTQQNFYTDPFWKVQRTMIVSLFLFCAGLGQAVAHAQGQGWPRFWKRWGQIAACALLVTAGSMVFFPRSYIYFGVLHGIAVMLVIVRLTAGWGRGLWLAGALAIAAFQFGPWLHAAAGGALAFLDTRAFNWIGLISRAPVTEDYVPVLPWIGVMWWGMAAGQWLLAQRPALVQASLPAWTKPLAWLGTWSLTWYMLHQPVMIGVLKLLRA